MIFKAGSTFSVLTLSPNQTPGEDKIAVYFHQTLYPPWTKKPINEKNLPQNHSNRSCGTYSLSTKKSTGGAAHRSLERPKYLATSAHAKEPWSATQRQQGGYQQPIGNELHCPLPTCCLDDFPFPGNSSGLFSQLAPV